jgi:hypothetical protein
MRRREFMLALAAGAGTVATGWAQPGPAGATERKRSKEPSQKAGTAFFYHPAFLKHATGAGHPECPQRLTSILDQLKAQGLWERLEHPEPKAATLETIALVHDPAYVALAEKEIKAGARCLSTGDVTVGKDSWEAAVLAVGAATGAVDLVCQGQARNAFCAVRPPGHHARPKGLRKSKLTFWWRVGWAGARRARRGHTRSGMSRRAQRCAGPPCHHPLGTLLVTGGAAFHGRGQSRCGFGPLPCALPDL